MTTIQGSRNVLVGAGAALPDSNASDQVVIGSAASTAYLAWDGAASSGVSVAGSETVAPALALGTNTALTVAGSKGTAGATLVSRGTNLSPEWKTLPESSSVDFTESYSPSTISTSYTAVGLDPCTLTLPTAPGGSTTVVKNMSPATLTLESRASYTLYPLGLNFAVSSILLSPGGSASLTTDGTYWYQMS